MTTLRALVLALVLPTASAIAAPGGDGIAQDSGDDLDDILGTDGPEEPASVSEERRAIEREAAQETSTVQEIQVAEPNRRRLRGIRALPHKPFLKMGRVEAVPYVGIVTNDPFIRRILFGASLGYHLTDIFEIELQGSFAPDFGEGDYKAVTRQITAPGANQVAPEISRMMWHLTGNFNYSPFYGKVATRRSTIVFDIYGSFGAGVVGTKDDLELISGNNPTPQALATENQVHPALTVGAGVRVAFNRTFALRFEGRTISYISVLESTQLELKNNLTLMLGASIFFGRRLE